MLARVILIPFEQVPRQSTDEQETVWQCIFDKLLIKTSSAVGEVIQFGHWLTNSGREMYNECLAIVLRGLGKQWKGSRMVKMWACGLLAARKVLYSTDSLNINSYIRIHLTTRIIY